MSIYLISMGLIPLWALFTHFIENSDQRKRITSNIIFIQLFLLSALRSPMVSFDTRTYIGIFNRVQNIRLFDFKSLQDATTFEIGFSYLNKFISYISMNAQLYIAITSFLTLYLIKKCIDKQSKIIWLSYFLLVSLGFYTSFLSMIRQGLAMAIVMLSYNYLNKTSKKKFILLIILAFTIHQTSAIFLIMHLFIERRLNNKLVGLFLASIPIVYIFSDKILNIFFSLTKYGYRAQKAIAGEGEALLLVYIAVFIAALVFKDKIMKRDQSDGRLYFIAGFTILCQLLALQFSLFSRVALYFSIFHIILIPNVLASIKNPRIRIMGILIVVLLTPALLYVNLSKNLGGVVPYFFMWQ